MPPDTAASDRKTVYREILIHQTRALTDFLNLKSHEGGVRIVLVYPADRIRAEAAASLLKSLEEPPENTVFMLVADEIDRVLPTIRSRCRLIRAGAPTREQALEWLKSQGVQDAERKLTEAGGMPLAVFDEDARFRLADETRERFLAYLRLGHAAPPAQALSVADKDVTLSAAALFLSRWGWDLASAKVGCESQYFPEFAEEIKTIAQAARSPSLACSPRCPSRSCCVSCLRPRASRSNRSKRKWSAADTASRHRRPLNGAGTPEEYSPHSRYSTAFV